MIDDSFEDTLNEFYLYLHDVGVKDDDCEAYYQPLRRIKNKQVFAGWMMRTYQYFLSNKVKRLMMTPLYVDLPDEQPSDSVKNWERRIWDMAVLIVYAYQNLSTLTKFIFFRSMLSVMNKQLCVSNQLMAQVLGISYVDYRVRKHYAWQKVRNKRKRMLEGERIKLDAEGIAMAKRLFANYGALFTTLRLYYQDILDVMMTKEVIKAVLAVHERGSF